MRLTMEIESYHLSLIRNSQMTTGKKRSRELNEVQGLCQFQRGDFVVIQDPELENAAYNLPFFVCEIVGNLDDVDTSLPDAELLVQIYRPCDMKSLRKKFVRWQGPRPRPWQYRSQLGCRLLSSAEKNSCLRFNQVNPDPFQLERFRQTRDHSDRAILWSDQAETRRA